MVAVEVGTRNEKGEIYRYEHTVNEKVVSDIPLSFKQNALCNTLLPKNKIKWTLINLRIVRNEGEHRCIELQNEEDETDKLSEFFRDNDFNSVRIVLKKIVSTVEENLPKKI